MKILKQSYAILFPESDAELIKQAQLVDRVARYSRKSEGNATSDSYKRLLPFLLEQTPPHTSVFEFSFLVVVFTTDRGLSHEIVRHRHTAFNQTSTRYVCYAREKFGSEISVIKPSGIPDNSVAYSIWHASCLNAEDSYLKLTEQKVKPEFARSVLPTCTATELVVGTSFREWREIFKLRLDKTAHPDIRRLFYPLFIYLKSILPEVYPEEYPNPYEEELNV